MSHMDRGEARIERLLRHVRTIGVVGASPRPERHSHVAVHYLHHAGFDIIPVRPDRATVQGLPTYARLADVAGSVDLVVIFRRAADAARHIAEAVAKRAEAVWLPPGAWSVEAEREAREHGLMVVKDRCIVEVHRHLFGAKGEPRAGHPRKMVTPRTT
jgi:predicted CoA-binding protein